MSAVAAALRGAGMAPMGDVVDLGAHREWRTRNGVIVRERHVPDRFHAVYGKGQVLDPDGSVVQDLDWCGNALADEGEQYMINASFRNTVTAGNKYLALVNMGAIAETTTLSTMTGEVSTANGYARQLIAAGDWAAPVLNSGDYQSTATEETFGPASTGAWTVTHAVLATTTDNTGLLLLYVPLSATTTVAIGQSFKYTLTFKQT